MIGFREAQRLVFQEARSFGQEEIPLGEAFGRVLSEHIRADRDYPPFDRAIMDGYALRLSDLERGIDRFRVVETIFAGSESQVSAGSGECHRIMTGSAVPPDADIVIRREDVEESELVVKVPLTDGGLPWRPYQNIARRGEDLIGGATIIDSPRSCEPIVMSLLAALGRTRVMVKRQPAIALLTTGNEVVPVDAPVGRVQIRNSNRWLLEAALKNTGHAVATWIHAPDDPRRLSEEAAQLLAAHDILICCGGVSAGDADYVPEVLASLGVHKLFHKLAIRPGKPVWCGMAPADKMVFALPGNPFSCLVNMLLLIQPYLQACDGLQPCPPVGLPLGEDRKKRTPLDEFFPVILSGSPAKLIPVAFNSSGDIRLGVGATGMALHPADGGDLTTGAWVAYYPFR
jgi:molybdopterin molybdotransferase